MKHCMFARHGFLAALAYLVAACSSGPPSRALHMRGKEIKVTDRPASKEWTFHFEGGQDQTVTLQFKLNGEPVNFGSVSCRKEGTALLLEPHEGVGKILIPAPVLEDGITAAFSLAPNRSESSRDADAEAGYKLSVSFRLDAPAGAWIPAARIPLPPAPFHMIGSGHGSLRVPPQDSFGAEMLFLSLYDGDEALAYFKVDALIKVEESAGSSPGTQLGG
jgi:hypothetical protein